MGLVESTGLYNSHGVNTIATGAFGPGVTASDVYRMLGRQRRREMARTIRQCPVLLSMAEQLPGTQAASHRLNLRPRLRDDGEPVYRSEEVGSVWPYIVRLWPSPQFL